MTPPRPILLIGWASTEACVPADRRAGRARAAPATGWGRCFCFDAGEASGEPRRNGLYYIEDGPDLVVVASNAGDDADPSWWRNLQAAPGGRGRDRAEAIAGPRPPAPRPRSGARLWPRLVAANPDYATYARRQPATSPSSSWRPAELVGSVRPVAATIPPCLIPTPHPDDRPRPPRRRDDRDRRDDGQGGPAPATASCSSPAPAGSSARSSSPRWTRPTTTAGSARSGPASSSRRWACWA